MNRKRSNGSVWIHWDSTEQQTRARSQHFEAIASLLFQTLRGARAADLLISFLASREGLLAGGGA